jgi:hypothetical protein
MIVIVQRLLHSFLDIEEQTVIRRRPEGRCKLYHAAAIEWGGSRVTMREVEIDFPTTFQGQA